MQEKPPINGSDELQSEPLATPSSPQWMIDRERLVQDALGRKDLIALRRISAMPGGFGSDEMRRKVWPVLLNTERFFGSDEKVVSTDAEDKEALKEAKEENDTTLADSSKLEDDAREGKEPTRVDYRHPDEAQVLLDTKRSFVSYPKDLPRDHKLEMQADLQDLIVGVLRLYPSLSYFQGFHDILSVLYLTFIPVKQVTRSKSRTTSRNRLSETNSVESISEDMGDGLQKEKSHVEDDTLHSRETPEWIVLRQCAAVVSLCRVRDGMGSGLEGVMGLLKILKRVLRAADPELDRFSSSISPVPTLPFFALSWILCLFSHDVDTLEPIQRMFDFLLSRNPISAIYLAVAILMAKKAQMLALAKNLGPEYEDDPSLLHPLFARLPPLFPDTPDDHLPTTAEAPTVLDDDDPNPYTPIPLSELFELTDQLMLKFPWDGATIKGKEIMGEASVVCSYDFEVLPDPLGPLSNWDLTDALKLVDGEVVLPGAAGIDDDEPPRPPIRKTSRQPLRLPKDRVGTAIAFGIVLVGIGIGVYGVRSGGSGWGAWWRVVITSWVGKSGLEKTGIVGGLRSVKEVLDFCWKAVGDVV